MEQTTPKPAANPDVLITVVAVIHDDEDILEPFVDELSAVLGASYRYHEILLVDNGSGPGTVAAVARVQARVSNVRCLRLSRAYETETALAAGLDNAIGDYVVLMQIDGDPPALVPAFVERAMAGSHVVIGERKDRADDTLGVRLFARPMYKLANRMLRVDLHPNATYFRVLSRQVVNAIGRIRNKSRYLNYLTIYVGFSQTFVSYERAPRRAPRRQGTGLLQGLRKGADLVFSNSATPLRLISLLGLGASGLSLLFVLYVFGVRVFKSRVTEGWITTNLLNSTMFFFVFLMLSVLSEYMARVLEETKEMPLYFTESETSSAISHVSELEEKHVNVV